MPYQIAQIAGITGLGRQGKEFDAQSITFAEHVLLDHSFIHEAAQQAMSRGLGKADLLSQLRDPLTTFRTFAQTTQHGKQPGNSACADFF
ncbi:hypothetical protein PSCICG_11370 [Pseudomonas cichorii]|nr:hypothetical protein PSCICG_11370 [Pseudomonas cichorii]